MKLLGASCPPKRSRKRPFTRWEYSLRIQLWLNPVSGTFCVSSRSSKRPQEKLSLSSPFLRKLQPKLRTLAFGWGALGCYKFLGYFLTNFCRYDSRSGTHNMYREYRDLSVSGAVTQCYRDMGARHRARAHAIQVGFTILSFSNNLMSLFCRLSRWNRWRLLTQGGLKWNSSMILRSGSHCPNASNIDQWTCSQLGNPEHISCNMLRIKIWFLFKWF